MTLRDIAPATGLSLGTLNKRTKENSHEPEMWVENGFPYILMRGMYWLLVLVACIGCLYHLGRACFTWAGSDVDVLYMTISSLFSRRGTRPC